jgi:hypothetical protein
MIFLIVILFFFLGWLTGLFEVCFGLIWGLFPGVCFYGWIEEKFSRSVNKNILVRQQLFRYEINAKGREGYGARMNADSAISPSSRREKPRVSGGSQAV